LLGLAWPLVLFSVLQGFVGFVDAWMVGGLGAAAVAAVGLSRQVWLLVLAAGTAFSSGTTILVAQAIGAGQPDQARRVLNQGVLAAAVGSGLLLVPVSGRAAVWILFAMGAKPEVIAVGAPYLRLLSLSVPFTLVGFVASAGLRGAGDTRTPLVIAVAMNVVHVAANYAFLFGHWGCPRLEVTGAALGSLLARVFALILSLAVLTSGRFALRFGPGRDFTPNVEGLRRLCRLGVPTALDGVALNAAGALMQRLVAATELSTVALSAYHLGMQLRTLATWIGVGLSSAAVTMVGQNIGAGKFERAARGGWQAAALAAAWTGFVGLAFFVFARPLMATFIADAAVIAHGVEFLCITALGLPFLGLGLALSGALQGAGNTVSPFRYSLVSQFLVGLPLAYFLAFPCGWQTTGLWIGFTVSLVVRGALNVYKFRQGDWRGRSA
jgi:putative MATE family efflux protein